MIFHHCFVCLWSLWFSRLRQFLAFIWLFVCGSVIWYLSIKTLQESELLDLNTFIYANYDAPRTRVTWFISKGTELLSSPSQFPCSLPLHLISSSIILSFGLYTLYVLACLVVSLTWAPVYSFCQMIGY